MTIAMRTAPATIRANVSDASIYYLFVLSGAMQPQMGIAVDFAAHVDEALLARSLRVLMETEPPLGYRFAPDSRDLVWERVETPAENAILPVQQTADPEADLHAFLASPFDESVGQQVRGRLLRARDRDTLALQVSHVAVDGRGAAEVLYRLCEMHRTLADDPEWNPPFNGTSVRDFVAAGVPARLRDKVASFGTFATSLANGEWRLPADTGARGSDAYTLAFLEPDLLESLKRAGRARGATLNDLLLAAFYRSLRETLRPPRGAKTAISIGADLRRYLAIDSGWGLSNFAAFVGLRLIASEKDDFEAALTQMRDAMKPLKDDSLRQLAFSRTVADKMANGPMRGMWRKSMVRMSEVVRKATSGEGGATAPVLTNIGEIDAEKVLFGDGADVADARWFVQVGHGTALTLGVSTFRGRAQLCASADPEAMDPQVPRAVLDGMVWALEDWLKAQDGASV